MKKKIIAIGLSIGLLSFFATTLNTSISSSSSAQPLISVSGTEQVVTADASEATPSAFWASAARAVVVYGGAAAKEAVKGVTYLAGAGRLVMGTELQNQVMEGSDEIFDK